jgi:hypothetical protein
MVQFLARVRDFSFLKNVQCSSGVHPPTYSAGIGVAFCRDKAVTA